MDWNGMVRHTNIVWADLCRIILLAQEDEGRKARCFDYHISSLDWPLAYYPIGSGG